MDDQKPLDMDDFKEQVGANRIRMASAESLAEKMQLPAGTVSPFGLLNNEEKIFSSILIRILCQRRS